jgi:hypothetical protein
MVTVVRFKTDQMTKVAIKNSAIVWIMVLNFLVFLGFSWIKEELIIKLNDEKTSFNCKKRFTTNHL